MTSSPETPPASSSDAGKTEVGNPRAFPFGHNWTMPNGEPMWRNHEGMTLRDWFAGQCLVSSPLSSFGDRDYFPRARRCYEMADAMLEARAVQS